MRAAIARLPGKLLSTMNTVGFEQTRRMVLSTREERAVRVLTLRQAVSSVHSYWHGSTPRLTHGSFPKHLFVPSVANGIRMNAGMHVSSDETMRLSTVQFLAFGASRGPVFIVPGRASMSSRYIRRSGGLAVTAPSGF